MKTIVLFICLAFISLHLHAQEATLKIINKTGVDIAVGELYTPLMAKDSLCLETMYEHISDGTIKIMLRFVANDNTIKFGRVNKIATSTLVITEKDLKIAEDKWDEKNRIGN